MKPEQFIKYTQMLDKKGLAICDGLTEPMSFFDVLYPMFIMSGIGFFLWVLVKWDWFKNKIRGN